MTLALIVPVINKFDLFTDAMRSVDLPIRPYIIDNYVANRGVASSWNEGMWRAMRDGYQYAVISNDDVIFSPGSLKKLYEEISKGEHVIIGADQHLDRPDTGLIDDDNEDELKSLFFCFAVDIKTLWKKCGPFDENFFPAYFEDNDMRRRIELAGLSVKIHTGAKVFHYHSASQYANDSEIVTAPMFEINKLYFKSKWGGMPREETYTTPFGKPNLTIRDWKINEEVQQHRASLL